MSEPVFAATAKHCDDEKLVLANHLLQPNGQLMLCKAIYIHFLSKKKKEQEMKRGLLYVQLCIAPLPPLGGN